MPCGEVSAIRRCLVAVMGGLRGSRMIPGSGTKAGSLLGCRAGTGNKAIQLTSSDNGEGLATLRSSSRPISRFWRSGRRDSLEQVWPLDDRAAGRTRDRLQ